MDKMMMVGVMVVMMMVELMMRVELMMMMVEMIVPLWPTRVGEGRGQQLVFACSMCFALTLKWSFFVCKAISETIWACFLFYLAYFGLVRS